MKTAHQQQEKINKITKQLHELSNQYQTPPSLFDSICTWFSQRSWWGKIGIILVNTIIFGLTGVMINPLFPNIILIGGMVGAGVSMFILYLLTQHHHHQKQQHEKQAQEIQHLKQTLTDSILVFQSLEVPMKEMVSSLHKKNSEKEEDIAAFKKTIEPLSVHATQLDESAKAFKHDQTAFATHTRDFGQAVQQTQDLQENLHQDQTDLRRLNTALDETKTLLQQSTYACQHLNVEISKNTSELDALNQKFITLEFQANATKIELEAERNRLQDLTHQIPITTETIDEAQESNQDLQKRLKETFERYKKYYTQQTEASPRTRTPQPSSFTTTDTTSCHQTSSMH